MNSFTNQYLYTDIIISPYYAPIAFWQYPSLVGYNSFRRGYVEHYKSRRITSLPIHNVKPEQTIRETCIYCGWLAYYVFGHFIYESLSAMYFVKLLPPSLPLIFSYSAKKHLETWQREIFDLLGIKNEIILLDKTTKFTSIYLPPPSMALGSFITDEAYNTLGVIPDNSQKGKKIYISRRNFKKRGAINENELEDMLLKRGWEILFPEKLPILEQLQQYASAETIFTISGSALHSILFLKNPSQRFIVIPRIHNRSFNIIANKKSNNYYILNCHMKNINGLKRELAIFELDIKEIESYLNKSSDFTDIEHCQFLSIPSVESDASSIPPQLMSAAIYPTLSNSLLYRILKALKTNTGVAQAKKCLRILLAKDLLKLYMERACKAFAEAYMPEIAFLLDIKFLSLKSGNLYDTDKVEALTKIVKRHTLFELQKTAIYNTASCKFLLSYRCHLSRLGWIEPSLAPYFNGRPSASYQIEAIRASFGSPRLGIRYGILTPANQWLWNCDGGLAGTVGKSQPATGLIFRLSTPSDFNLTYRAYIHKRGWSPWAHNGDSILFPGTFATAIQLQLKEDKS